MRDRCGCETSTETAARIVFHWRPCEAHRAAAWRLVALGLLWAIR